MRLVGNALFVTVIFSLGCGGEDQPPEPPAIPPSQRTWSAPETLEAARLSLGIEMAHDPRGSVMVVWDDLDGNVKAKHYDATLGAWGAAHDLDAENPQDAAAPSVAMDAQGNAIAVWQRQSQSDDMRSVWASRFDAATRSWSPAQLVPGSELVLAPQLAMDGAGNAVLAFTRSEVGVGPQTARFDAATRTWSPAAPLAPAQGFAAGAPTIAMARAGAGVAIWQDGDLTTSAIWAARLAAGSATWSAPEMISANANMAQPTGVAINDRGMASAVWVQLEGEKFTAWSSRAEASGAAWSAPERLDPGSTADVLLPRVAVDAAGNSIVAWTANDDVRRTVWGNRFNATARAWQGPEMLDDGGEAAYVPSMDIDGQGNTLIVWTRREGTRRSPWARCYIAAESRWDATYALDAAATGRSEYPAIEVLDDGSAIAVWSRDAESLVASHLR